MTRVGRVLATAATVLALLAIFAVWVDRQLLEDQAWDETSSALIQDAAIRGEVAAFLTDELFAAEDVGNQLEDLLPARASGLVGPATTGLREVAERGIARLLGRPHVQDLWKQTTARAHATFVKLIEGDGSAGDDVVLDLQELLEASQQRAGVGGRAAKALPPEAGTLTILRADNLRLAQDLVEILDGIVILLCALTLAFYAGAVALARGARREILRACGLGLVAAGALVLVARTWAGDAVVDALAADATRPAADATWSIGTSLLAEIASAVLGYGIVIVAAAWLSGPSGRAVAARRALAPSLLDARLAYGAIALLVVLLIAWDPAPATHRVVPMVVFGVLLALGIGALRRQVAGEHAGPRGHV